MENNKDFDFKKVPGKKLEKELSINSGKPLISIATPYYNCKDYIMETVYSILNQTFPYWEWVIMNDGSTEEGTEEILDKVAKLDSRIRILKQENQGRLAARDNAIKATKCDWVLTLDSDDCLDKTFLETAYWTLRTNPDATWAYCDMVTFDGQNFLWKKIFDCEEEKTENILSQTALIKKEAIFQVGGYSAVDKDVHEDWHLWLRMLEKGLYPVRMNYYGIWYRQKLSGSAMALIKQNKAKQKHAMEEIKKQAKKIKKNVAAKQYPMSTDFYYDSQPYTFEWDRKPINEKGKKINILCIFPWFKLGGADKFNLDLLSGLDKNKYNITIVTTEPCDYIWRQQFEDVATVFDLTTFLHAKDWPAFMDYLIKSRNIDIVFQSNSYFGYSVIPWLKCKNPEVKFTDYIHSETWGWRNGDYPRDSTSVANLLEKTYTCNSYVGRVMTDMMGRHNKNVETVYIGVDIDRFNEENVNIDDYPEITKYKEKYEGKKVILFLSRLSIEKRPKLAIKVFAKMLEKNKNLVLFVVGPGELENSCKKLCEKLNIEDNVIFFGSQKDTRPFYKLAHVELICSLVEGLTLTTYEGLSMKTPVVSADIGGQKELIDDSCGRLVTNVQDSRDLKLEDYTDEEIERYQKALESIVNMKESEYKKMRNICREKVINGFTISNMVEKFDKEFSRMAKEKSKVPVELTKNEDLYSQFLVLYNELNPRFYFPTEGGYNVKGVYDEKLQRFRDNMWQNPLWRGFIGVLHTTGAMNFAKKKGVDKKIKKAIIDKMK